MVQSDEAERKSLSKSNLSQSINPDQISLPVQMHPILIIEGFIATAIGSVTYIFLRTLTAE